MSVEENKRVVRRQFELISSGDAVGATALWAIESSNHGRKVTPEALSKVFEALASLHETHTLHEMIGEGDWVAVRTTCNGRHSAEPAIPVNGGIFTGLRPTGRSYTVQHVHLFKVLSGKLVEHWANRDDLGAAQQIGLVLQPPTEP